MRATRGEIYWEGQPIVIQHPRAAQDLGIGIIYQEFDLVPQLSIAENVWISREPFRNRALQLIDWKGMRCRTQERRGS
jgi:ribose transport system ATP-binding protein